MIEINMDYCKEQNFRIPMSKQQGGMTYNFEKKKVFTQFFLPRLILKGIGEGDPS